MLRKIINGERKIGKALLNELSQEVINKLLPNAGLIGEMLFSNNGSWELSSNMVFQPTADSANLWIFNDSIKRILLGYNNSSVYNYLRFASSKEINQAITNTLSSILLNNTNTKLELRSGDYKIISETLNNVARTIYYNVNADNQDVLKLITNSETVFSVTQIGNVLAKALRLSDLSNCYIGADANGNIVEKAEPATLPTASNSGDILVWHNGNWIVSSNANISNGGTLFYNEVFKIHRNHSEEPYIHFDSNNLIFGNESVLPKFIVKSLAGTSYLAADSNGQIVPANNPIQSLGINGNILSISSGNNVTLPIADGKVKVISTDNSDYLETKIIEGDNVFIETVDVGSNKAIKIHSTAGSGVPAVNTYYVSPNFTMNRNHQYESLEALFGAISTGDRISIVIHTGEYNLNNLGVANDCTINALGKVIFNGRLRIEPDIKFNAYGDIEFDELRFESNVNHNIVKATKINLLSVNGANIDVEAYHIVDIHSEIGYLNVKCELINNIVMNGGIYKFNANQINTVGGDDEAIVTFINCNIGVQFPTSSPLNFIIMNTVKLIECVVNGDDYPAITFNSIDKLLLSNSMLLTKQGTSSMEGFHAGNLFIRGGCTVQELPNITQGTALNHVEGWIVESEAAWY